MHGVGIYKWQDGKLYKGEYANDKKHGFGLYTLQDGRTYEGWWDDGKQHGLGEFVFADRNYFMIANLLEKSHNTKQKKGLWEDGKRIMWFDNPTTVEKLEQG